MEVCTPGSYGTKWNMRSHVFMHSPIGTGHLSGRICCVILIQVGRCGRRRRCRGQRLRIGEIGGGGSLRRQRGRRRGLEAVTGGGRRLTAVPVRSSDLRVELTELSGGVARLRREREESGKNEEGTEGRKGGVVSSRPLFRFQLFQTSPRKQSDNEDAKKSN